MNEDINLERRKEIIRTELAKLLGKSLNTEAVIERKRLKQKIFDRKKSKLKMAIASQRRNRE